MGNEKVEISVIVPVYNAEKYIVQMIESVIQQSYKEWELILVENGSIDKSLEICRRYEAKYSNIHVIQMEKQGAGYARNWGLMAAGGEYIAFVDADDYLAGDSILTQLVYRAKKENADITVCDYERLWKGKVLSAVSHRSFSKLDLQSEDFQFRAFFSAGNLSYVWGKLYKKSFLDEQGIRFSKIEYAEDKLFNMECYACGARYAFVDEIGYVYRKVENSISHQYNPKSSECWLRLSHRYVKWLGERGKDVQQYEGLVLYTIFFATFFAAKMEYEEHQKSIQAVRRILKIYGEDCLARACFRKLVKSERVRAISQTLWKVMIRVFSLGMTGHCYWLLSVGIQLLIEFRVDERLSDTGLRE